MPRPVNIVPVINIYESRKVRESVVSVVVYIQSTDATYKTEVVIKNSNASSTYDTSIIIIIYWYIFNLDHSTKIIILDIRVVIISTIKRDADISKIGIGVKTWTVSHYIEICLLYTSDAADE